jgi:hypothetical protein
MDRLELALELDLGNNSRGCLRRGWTGWNGLWSWIWEGILEAACGEDGQAGTGSGAGSGKEFLRLLAKRMDRLERALELDWEGILEAACEEDREAGTGPITSHPTRNGEVRRRYQIWTGRRRSSTGSVKLASEPEEPA